MWNKHQQWQDKKDFDRERFMVANGEVSQSQPHACQTPKPHLSSVALCPWCRLLVNGTSSSVQQVRRCGGEEVKTSFFITHFRKGEMKIRKLTTVQSWLITRLVRDSESQRRVNFFAINTQSKSKFPENHQLNEASISVWILKSCRLKTQTCTAIQPLFTPHCCSGPQTSLLGKSHGLAVASALQ